MRWRLSGKQSRGKGNETCDRMASIGRGSGSVAYGLRARGRFRCAWLDGRDKQGHEGSGCPVTGDQAESGRSLCRRPHQGGSVFGITAGTRKPLRGCQFCTGLRPRPWHAKRSMIRDGSPRTVGSQFNAHRSSCAWTSCLTNARSNPFKQDFVSRSWSCCIYAGLLLE